MNSISLNPKVKAADVPLERLAGSTKLSEQDKIAEASRQFEAVLLRQILAQAQKPLFQTNLFGNTNSSSSIYQDMVTQQMADRISQGGSFGFAKSLEKELTARYAKKSETKPLPAASAAQARAEVSRSAAPAAPAPRKYITVTPQPGKRI